MLRRTMNRIQEDRVLGQCANVPQFRTSKGSGGTQLLAPPFYEASGKELVTVKIGDIRI